MPCSEYIEMAKSMGIDCSKFSDEEQEKIAAKIRTLMDEGKSQEQAIAIAINMIAPEKSTSEREPTERRVNASGLPSTVDGFDAEWTTDGHLVMKDVPIFLPTSKKGHEFSAEWIRGALADAKKGEKDGYLPPMHVKHHKRDGDSEVIPAGMFRMKSIEERVFKDETFPMLIADKIFTNPDVIDAVMAGRLPYRSVEIYDADEEKIDSLALLDDEAPFLELPITRIRSVRESGESVTPETFSRDWEVSSCGCDGPLVACFSRGGAHSFLMEKPMGTMYTDVNFQKDPEEEREDVVDDAATEEAPEEAAGMTEEAPAEEAAPGEAEPFGGDETPEEEMAEEMVTDEAPTEAPDNISPSVEAIIGAIVSGSISVADMDAIEHAISERRGANAEPEPEQEEQEAEEIKETVRKDVEASPPPLASPGEAMKRDTDPERAAMMGRIEGLEEWKRDRQQDDTIREAVDEALESLAGRALGHDPRARFTAFAREHGVEAFRAYAEELVKELPPVSTSRFEQDPDSFDFGKSLPDEVLHFQKDGPEAVERAAGHARMYEELKGRGMVNVPLQRYLEINMNGLQAE